MKKVDTREIENVITSLFSSKVLEQKCLAIFWESIKQASLSGEDKWGVYYLKDRVRLLVGNLIVCTVHREKVWLALDRELLSTSEAKRNFLEHSEGWQWDFNSHPEYSQIPSKNGYYSPLNNDTKLWNIVSDLHFEFIRKVGYKYEKLNARSQTKHRPEVLTYLRQILGQPIPEPFYESEKDVEVGTNPLQEIEDHKTAILSLPDTERQAIVQSRVGQGRFRAKLIKYWGSCAITGCKNVKLLKASHVKPWRVATNHERLDVYNGLLLSPNLDAAFDNGLITFDNKGKIILSSLLSGGDLDTLGIHPKMRIRHLDVGHSIYLEYHRCHVFTQ